MRESEKAARSWKRRHLALRSGEERSNIDVQSLLRYFVNFDGYNFQAEKKRPILVHRSAS